MLIEQQSQHTILLDINRYNYFYFNHNIFLWIETSTSLFRCFIKRLLEPVHMLGAPVAIYYKHNNRFCSPSGSLPPNLKYYWLNQS